MSLNRQAVSILLYCVFLQTRWVSADYHIMKFQKLTSGASLEHMGCAIERYGYELAVGARYDPTTDTCEALPDSWLSNQVQDGLSSYMKLTMIEDEYDSSQYREFPTKMVPGSRMIAYMTTQAIGSILYINFFNSGYSFSDPEYVICLHFKVFYTANRLDLNSYDGNVWRTEIQNTNVITSSYTDYKIEFQISDSGFQFYINDVYFGSFAHRYPLTECDVMNFQPSADSSDYLRKVERIYTL